MGPIAVGAPEVAAALRIEPLVALSMEECMTTEPASLPPALTLLDLLSCQHAKQAIEVPPWVTDRLRGLDLWAPLSPPEHAYHVCTAKHGCLVALVLDEGATVIALQDWQLAVDREGDAHRGIVVEDHTRGRS